MTKGTTREPEARYVRVQDVESRPAAGCTRTLAKQLITTERLAVRQLSIQGAGIAEDDGACDTNRALYVLGGRGVLSDAGRTEIEPGHLIAVPPGVRWGEQLCVLSDELALLEVARADGRTSESDTPKRQLLAIRPDDVTPYAPAGHAKTQNRCLFVDEHVEIIEGLIEQGGGAERHAHRDHEQLLYVLSGAGVPLLIHYPRGVAHGTGGGIAQPLRLLVVYSPPLGESQNALA